MSRTMIVLALLTSLPTLSAAQSFEERGRNIYVFAAPRAFISDGAGRRAYEQTREALREKSTLRKCSWQIILQHFRSAGVLTWLTDELSAKYGL